ncbi:MAG: hypothetical protein ACE5D3_04505 [Candidatus Binatia bacterium]
MSTACSQQDLVKGRSAAFLWLGPWAAIVVASFFGTTAQTMVWVPSFALMGVACLVNARGCGRLHCFLTGPLYLGGAASSLLVGLELVSVASNWILLAMVLGTVLAYVPEWIRGQYVTSKV